MKGKTLFHLTKDLNKSERHQILNICRKSGDKRHDILYKYLKTSIKNDVEHEDKLNEIAPELVDTKKVSAEEQDKTLRRFVDFSVKEIESLKLKNELDKNQKFRNFLLAQIHNKSSSQQLFNQYLKKTKQIASKEKDIAFESYCLDYEISNKSKFQKNKDLEILKDLLISKKHFNELIFHKKLSEIHNTLSGLYMSNKNLFEDLKQEISTETNELSALLQMTTNTKASVIYALAKSRYNFLDKKVFKANVKETEQRLKEYDGSEYEKAKLERRISFLKVVGGFHYGEKIADVYKHAKNVIEIDNKLDFQDGLGAFYYLLLHLFYKGIDSDFQDVFDLYSEKHFNEDNAYMLTFIDAYILYLNNDYTKALRTLNYLSYSPNTYISIWSRILEIKIHFIKGDIGFCESLYNRLIRSLNNTNGNIFTFNSNQYLMFKLGQLLGLRNRKKSFDKEYLSLFHLPLDKWIETELKKQ